MGRRAPGSTSLMVKVGLVLGAGGIVGEAFHRGVVRALRDAAGWDAREASLIVGTSAGSLMAASLRAAGESLDGMQAGVHPSRTLASVPPDETAVPRFLGPGVAVQALRHPRRLKAAAIAGIPAGKHRTAFIQDGVRRRFGDRWTDRPTWVVAVRRRDGDRVVFGRAGAPVTDLGAAVGASCAIPGYFRPVVIGGEAYVDGGVHSPTSADLVADRGLDLVVVSSPMSAARSAWGTRRLDLVPRVYFARQLAREVKPLRRAGTALLVVEPDAAVLACSSLNAMAAHRVDEVEDTAYAQVERLLAADEDVARRLWLAGGQRDLSGAGGGRRRR